MISIKTIRDIFMYMFPRINVHQTLVWKYHISESYLDEIHVYRGYILISTYVVKLPVMESKYSNENQTQSDNSMFSLQHLNGEA